MIQGLWLFADYQTGRESDKIGKLIGFKFFLNHENMKYYSAKRSAKLREKYPDYCSMYWRLI